MLGERVQNGSMPDSTSSPSAEGREFGDICMEAFTLELMGVLILYLPLHRNDHVLIGKLYS